MSTSCHPGFINVNKDKEPELFQLDKLSELLVDQYPEAVYILDLAGNFAMVNEAACRLATSEKKLLLGRSYEAVGAGGFPGLSPETFLLASQGQSQRCEATVVTPTGTRCLEVCHSPLQENQEVVAVLGIARDITEQKEHEKERQRCAAQLKAQQEELEVFGRILSHDMRRPIANAIGFARLLEGLMLPLEKEKEIRTLLVKTVESVDAMVRDLNEVISLKSLGRESKELLQVQTSLESQLAFFGNDIKDIGATVTLQVAPELAVCTIKAYFNSILRNLISNALKYHSRQHPPLIQIKAQALEEGIEVSVRDNGIGMDMAKVAPELFKMHRRFAPALAEGNGLGLYIVQQQVQLLGGRITVESTPGVGTEFKVVFPLV